MNYTFSGFSKAGNAVVRGAIAAAQDMGHTYVGTEQDVYKRQGPALARALAWSREVNRRLTAMPKECAPFAAVEGCLAAVRAVADVVVHPCGIPHEAEKAFLYRPAFWQLHQDAGSY